MVKNPQKIAKILGVKIDFLSMEEVVEKIVNWLKNGEFKKYLVTPNPEIITYAQKDKEFRRILNSADLAIPDGKGILWAIKVLGKMGDKKAVERVAGTDLMLKLCKLAPKFGWRIGLIGGENGTVEKTAKALKKKFPGLKIELADSGGEIDKYGNSISRNPEIPRTKIDILFVAFGFPKQEYWIDKNKNSFPAKVFIPVGGAFDYISGKVKRAPKWMQKIGLEWLYRLIKEPWRIKRQLVGAKFFFLVLKERLKTCQFSCLPKKIDEKKGSREKIRQN